MKKLLLIPLVLMLVGCMTANQLEAEKAYYEMLTAKQAQTSPLVRLDVADPTKPINLKTIEVFAPPSNMPIAQYQQKDYVQPWLNVLSMAVPWLGVYGVTSAVVSGMKEMGGTTYNQSGTGNKMVGGNLADSTSVPTVVYQAPPVIVDPVIVP